MKNIFAFLLFVVFLAVSVAALVFLSYWTVSAARAAIISEHNNQHTADNVADALMRERGCAVHKTVMKKRFTVEETDGKIYVVPTLLEYECVEQVEPEPTPTLARAMISWERPEAREDGSLLTEDQICCYRVYANSELVANDVLGLSVEIQLDPGQYQISVSTVDSNNTEGARSAPFPLQLL